MPTRYKVAEPIIGKRLSATAEQTMWLHLVVIDDELTATNLTPTSFGGQG